MHKKSSIKEKEKIIVLIPRFLGVAVAKDTSTANLSPSMNVTDIKLKHTITHLTLTSANS